MRYLLPFFIVIFSLALSAQEILSAEEAREDVSFLYKRMNQVHPGLYRYQSKKTYENTYQDIKESLNDSIDYFSFFRRISPLVYEVKDLHTSYSHSKNWRRQHRNRVPFIMKEIEGVNLVQYNASTDSTFLRGLEVLAIGGMPIEELKTFLRTNIGTDKGNESAKQLYSTRSLYGYYPKFYELGDSINIKARHIENDSIIDFKLRTVRNNELGLNVALRYPLKIRKNLSYKLIDSTLSLAKIDVSSFVQKSSPLDIFQMKFGRQLKKDFKKVRKDSVEHLLIDFRGNGGGYIPNVSKLMKYLAKERFKLIDTMAFKRTAYFKIFPVQRIMPPLMAPFFFNKTDREYRFRANGKPPKKKPSRLAFDGDLYVFMDAGSYSATAFALCLLKDMERATFLGESPGGANWGSHAGSWHVAKLPNSKIKLRIPQYRIVHARPKKSHDDFFIQPDVPLKYTLEDFDANEDSYEKALIKLIVN